MALEETFTQFSKFGNTNSKGTHITLSQSDKWMKQAKVFDKILTTTDTAISFNKFKQKSLNYSDFVKYLQDLASSKKIDVNKLKEKLASCGAPGIAGTTQTTNVGGVDRLTDTSKYTGTHKERFDASGKGKGKTGREDVSENTGYVGGYKGKDTYNETHK